MDCNHIVWFSRYTYSHYCYTVSFSRYLITPWIRNIAAALSNCSNSSVFQTSMYSGFIGFLKGLKGFLRVF